MTKKIFIGTVAAGILLGFAFTVAYNAGAANTLTYKVLKLRVGPQDLENDLNAMAAQGWTLDSSNGYFYIFKK